MDPATNKIKLANSPSGDVDGPAENLAAEKPSVVILTKTYDGGTPRSPKAGADEDTEAVDPKRKDPFLYYSNDANRLSYLLHQHDDVSDDEPELPTTTRKTRISFEVHPDLLLDDMLFNATAVVQQEQANE